MPPNAETGDAARIGVLDDRASGGPRRIELRDEFESRVGVTDVIALALHLSCHREPSTMTSRRIESSGLMRVLAHGEPASRFGVCAGV
jgi:hypothetical protein